MYSFTDVLLLRVIAELLSSGISVARLRTSFSVLKKRQSRLRLDSLAPEFLATDGRNLYLCGADTTLENLSEKGQLAFLFVLHLSTLRDDIRQRAQEQKLNGL